MLERWAAQPHVAAANPHDSWNWRAGLERAQAWHQPFIAEFDQHPIGFIQLTDPSREKRGAWGEGAADCRAIDLWVGEPENLGQGYGTTMMQLILARCFSDPRIPAVLVDPLVDNRRARRFCERLGFRCIEERHLGDDLCAIYRLERQDWLN